MLVSLFSFSFGHVATLFQDLYILLHQYLQNHER
jgi:hypothetical protein